MENQFRSIDDINDYAQNLRLKTKDYMSAIFFYTKVIEMDPTYEHAYFRRGLCKGALGDLNGQIEDYSKYIEINKPDSDNFVSRAIIKFKAKHYYEAIEDCKIALALNKNNTYASKLISKSLQKLEIE